MQQAHGWTFTRNVLVPADALARFLAKAIFDGRH
jgi:hypothetical protein